MSRFRHLAVTLAVLAACGGGTPVSSIISVSLSPPGGVTVNPGQTVAITATVGNDASHAGVTWSLAGAGSLDTGTETSTRVTYVAPATASTEETATITAVAKTSTSAVATLQVLIQADPGVTVTISPKTPQTLTAGQTVALTAAVANDPTNAGVTWSVSGAGTLSGQTATSATYQAPASVTTPQNATVTATANNGGAGFASLPITVFAPGMDNSQPVTLDGFVDGMYTTVTVCVPGTSECNTIDHVLVDTGSSGLRLLPTAAGGELSLTLPQVTAGGAPVQNCVSFADTSYLWGNLVKADVRIAGEVASAVPIQVPQDPTSYRVPSSCTGGSTLDDNSVDELGANGILGVGTEPNDCTLAGVNYCNGPTPVPVYYTCTSFSCAEVLVPPNLQVTNPIVLFPQDNNGVVIDLPAVNGSVPTLSGTMTFGIGTRANNALGSATVYTTDSSGNFTTTFASQTLPASYIDSGTNGLFFPGNIPACTGDLSSLYCPTSLQSLSAQNQGATQGSGTVDFAIDNGAALVATNDSACSDLGGPNGSFPCSGDTCSFVWGLPFFFGHKVFTAIDLQTVAGEPAPPWWAYP